MGKAERYVNTCSLHGAEIPVLTLQAFDCGQDVIDQTECAKSDADHAHNVIPVSLDDAMPA